MTDSGYPLSVRRWKRGEPLQQAVEVHTGDATDVAAGAYRTWDGDKAYDIAYTTPSFFTNLSYLLHGGW